MHATKALLILRNGLRCMGCGKVAEYKDIQWHHIKPKYASKANHEPVDDSYENGSLLCKRCHIEIHKYLWWDMEYQLLTDLIEDNKR
ncbi:MAG: HNH endonuclease [Clostridia bacterium]|nr:HNH endonuclease [Clostridia bacterium]